MIGDKDFFEWHYAGVAKAQRQGFRVGFGIGIAIGMAIALVAATIFRSLK